jgi:hypothetical protein
MRRASPALLIACDPVDGIAGAAVAGAAGEGAGSKLLLLKPVRDTAGERGAGASCPGADMAGLAEVPRGIAASVASGRGVWLIKTGCGSLSATAFAAGASRFGRKTAKSRPVLLRAAGSGEETSFSVNFGTVVPVAAAICPALTPRLRILPPEKE